jgi:hypothetical protein
MRVMITTVRSLSRGAVLAAVGSIALSGCGGASTPVVASVHGSVITEGALAHWTRIKRAELQSSSKPSSLSSVQVKQKALAFLITADWLEQEAAAEGVSASRTEVKASYEQLLNAPTGSAVAASLARRGMSSADELLILRLGALAQKLRAKITASRQGLLQAGGQERVSSFIAAYRARWKQRTTCRPGYVIAECREGPPLSGSPARGS